MMRDNNKSYQARGDTRQMQSTFAGSSEKPEDWTFATEDTRKMTHGIHAYPARMVPQVVEKLINKYANRDGSDRCCDCFCGSGTVLVEAKLQGIPSIGVDANPLAALISKVKSTPLPREQLETYAARLHDAIDADKGRDVDVPSIRNLKHWFKPSVQKQLVITKEHIDNIRNSDIRDFFKVCYSVTVRKVSNIRPGEFKLYRIPEEKLKDHKPDVLKEFTKIVNANILLMDKFERVADKSVESFVIQGDTRKLLQLAPDKIYEGCSTLLITSPPYGDSHTTVAYGQFSRYSSAWLGFAEDDYWHVDKVALGGRIFKEMDTGEIDKLESPTLKKTLSDIMEKDAYRAKETYAFFKDMDQCFEQIAKVMKPGKSTICFVLGNRTVKRVKVHTDDILMEMGGKHGFRFHERFHREIPNKTMPVLNAPENVVAMKGETMSKESIVVWKY